MKVKFEIIDGQLCRTVEKGSISCSTYYELGEAYDLETFLDVINNAKEFILRYREEFDG